MQAAFEKIGVIGKPGDPRVIDTLRALVRHLVENGFEVTADTGTADLLERNGCGTCPRGDLARKSDLVIVVGGDGTFLGAARALAAGNVPLLGVNLGRLGFLVDISPDTMCAALDRILAGDYDEEHRFLLAAHIGASAQPPPYSLALNDVVLHKWNTPRMMEFETHIDGQFVNRQRADGLIVSTPTGSTAYALSGGGALLHPSLNALILVPICPHTLSNRPIVVNGDSHIEIRICGADHEHVRISCDGQTDRSIGPGDNLYIRKSEYPLRLLHPKGHDHYRLLRAKLGWSEHPAG